jgi:signal transduction histidine kinase
VDQLQVGLYVYLDLKWFEHPFAFSHFKIKSEDQIQTIRKLGVRMLRFSPELSEVRQWTNLETGLESTLRVVWNELKYKATVVKEFAGMAPIECFAFQLNQVFMNLLVNAAHAIEARGTITLRTGQDDDVVWVQVQDSGQGIKPEHLSRIFEPFFTTKPVGKGTGLGLSVAYGIVKKHDGRIEVKSDLGRGSSFTVILPKKTVPLVT